MMKNEVLMIIGDASEMLDTFYPYYRLQEEGFRPVVAAPEKRRYQLVLHEIKPGWTITKEWEGYTMEADVAFKDIDPDDYLGIFFSGGRAPEYIRDDPDLINITRDFFEKNKPIQSLFLGYIQVFFIPHKNSVVFCDTSYFLQNSFIIFGVEGRRKSGLLAFIGNTFGKRRHHA